MQRRSLQQGPRMWKRICCCSKTSHGVAWNSILNPHVSPAAHFRRLAQVLHRQDVPRLRHLLRHWDSWGDPDPDCGAHPAQVDGAARCPCGVPWVLPAQVHLQQGREGENGRAREVGAHPQGRDCRGRGGWDCGWRTLAHRVLWPALLSDPRPLCAAHPDGQPAGGLGGRAPAHVTPGLLAVPQRLLLLCAVWHDWRDGQQPHAVGDVPGCLRICHVRIPSYLLTPCQRNPKKIPCVSPRHLV